MSTDWIKMRVDLRTHPKVVRMASALKADKLRVIGGLFAVWSIFDAHSSDGILEGYTFESIDDELHWKGFAKAMAGIDWLIYDETQGEGLIAPRFEEHNGQSAKRRAMETERKRLEREAEKSASDAKKAATKAGQVSASDADKSVTREEKRREEIRDTDAIASAAAKTPRATRKCPKGFEVTAELLAWHAEKTPSVDWRAETDKFIDHTFARAITDWDGCWRNWMRKAAPANAQRGFMTAKERDRSAAEARVREMTGGLLDRAFPKGDVIDMEEAHAAQIGNR